MKRLRRFNTDGKIIDTFQGKESNEDNEISFFYDQKFSFPQVSIYNESGEIDRVNFQVKKLTDHSMRIKFMEDLLPEETYTIKIS